MRLRLDSLPYVAGLWGAGWGLGWLVGLVSVLVLGCGRLRTSPWTYPAATRPALVVTNYLDKPCSVEVHSQMGQPWALGVVAPGETAHFWLPFADQRVRIYICGVTGDQIDIDGPYTWTTSVKRKEPSGGQR